VVADLVAVVVLADVAEVSRNPVLFWRKPEDMKMHGN
jgi:hypothetical protein